MCGIFGILSPNEEIDRRELYRLSLPNVQRGDRGFGWLELLENGWYLRQRRLESWAIQRISEVSELKGILCHVRAPTSGINVDSVNSIHPFESHKFLLAHNGLILNTREFPEWHKLGRIDSQVLLCGIQETYDRNDGDIYRAISFVSERLEGQHACWLYNKYSRQLYFWRVMSTLYYRVDGTTFTFSSSQIEGGTLLPEGCVIRVDPLKPHHVQNVGKIPFVSPYVRS